MKFLMFLMLVFLSNNAFSVKLIECEKPDGTIEYSDSTCSPGSIKKSETKLDSQPMNRVPQPGIYKKTNISEQQRLSVCSNIYQKYDADDPAKLELLANNYDWVSYDCDLVLDQLDNLPTEEISANECEDAMSKVNDATSGFNTELAAFMECSKSLGQSNRRKARRFNNCISPINTDKNCEKQFTILQNRFNNLESCSAEFSSLKAAYQTFYTATDEQKRSCGK